MAPKERLQAGIIPFVYVCAHIQYACFTGPYPSIFYSDYSMIVIGFKQVTFGEKQCRIIRLNILKQKRKKKRFYNVFPFHASMESVSSYPTSFSESAKTSA